jgi:hypothetical protein
MALACLLHLGWYIQAATVPAGNLNLDGPIYIDLEKRTSKNGEPVWQIKDVYYGERPGCHARCAGA